jgi:hypothetical protein
VIERFPSHGEAAAWYRSRDLPLPSNCLVPENPAKAFELTNRMPPASVRERILGQPNPVRAVRLWNATYRKRVTRWPVFLVTESEFLELRTPPRVTSEDLVAVFGRVPPTLTPPEVNCATINRLRERLSNKQEGARR